MHKRVLIKVPGSDSYGKDIAECILDDYSFSSTIKHKSFVLSFEVFYDFLFPNDSELNIESKKLKYNVLSKSKLYDILSDEYGENLIDELFEYLKVSEKCSKIFGETAVQSYTLESIDFSDIYENEAIILNLVYYVERGVWEYGSIEGQLDSIFYDIASDNNANRLAVMKYIKKEFSYLVDYESSSLYEVDTMTDSLIENILNRPYYGKDEWHLITANVHTLIGR